MARAQPRTAPRPARAVPAVRTKRLAARIPEDQKELLERAATIRGSTLTDFVLSAAHEAALQVIEQYNAITLSERDSRAFIAALRAAAPANETLRTAAERYKARMGDR